MDLDSTLVKSSKMIILVELWPSRATFFARLLLGWNWPQPAQVMLVQIPDTHVQVQLADTQNMFQFMFRFIRSPIMLHMNHQFIFAQPWH